MGVTPTVRRSYEFFNAGGCENVEREPVSGDVELVGNIGATKTAIDRLRRRLQSKARPLVVVYEAGPCGYGLCRQLIENGFECMVCAPSLLPKKPGERVKTDRRDTIKLVRALRMGDMSAVYGPSVEDEVPAQSLFDPGLNGGCSRE